MSSAHDKRIEAIDRKMKIGRFSPHHPSQFLKGYKKEGHHPQKMPKGLVSKAAHLALRERMMAPVDAPGKEHKNIKR